MFSNRVEIELYSSFGLNLMSKTDYFRTANQRSKNARRVDAQNEFEKTKNSLIKKRNVFSKIGII
jgi:hypothetical protein